MYLEGSEELLKRLFEGIAEHIDIQQDPWHDKVEYGPKVYKTRQDDHEGQMSEAT